MLGGELLSLIWSRLHVKLQSYAVQLLYSSLLGAVCAEANPVPPLIFPATLTISLVPQTKGDCLGFWRFVVWGSGGLGLGCIAL